MLIFKVLLVTFVIIQNSIRFVFQRRYATTHAQKQTEKEPTREKWLVRYVGSSYAVAVLIWVLTDWLSFAQMPFPDWLRYVGFLIGASSTYYFYLVHRQLGDNWSPVLEIRNKHQLVITGLYRFVRHPMYSSMLVGTVGISLLVANWVVVFITFLAFIVLCIVRIPDEEQLMTDTFGKQYQDYMRKTKRLIPNLF